MKTLVFEVRNQGLIMPTKCDVVAGSKGYLQAQFMFYGNDWRGCKMAASFWDSKHTKEYAVLLDKYGRCTVPDEVTDGDQFYVSLTGMKEGFRIKTNKVIVKQEVI